MTLKEHIAETYDGSIARAAASYGCPHETMRLWVLAKRTPRPPSMEKLISWSGGKVTAESFFRHEAA